MKVGDLVKTKGVDSFGIVVNVDSYGHFFVCWPNDRTYFFAHGYGLELVSESR